MTAIKNFIAHQRKISKHIQVISVNVVILYLLKSLSLIYPYLRETQQILGILQKIAIIFLVSVYPSIHTYTLNNPYKRHFRINH